MKPRCRRWGRESTSDSRGLVPLEKGGASVVVAGAVGVLVTALTGALLVASAVRDVHRARSAADLAALAGASGAFDGHGGDCSRSSAVARANGARMTGCLVRGDGSLLVTVDVPTRWPRGWPAIPQQATARARAGVVPAFAPP